MPRAWVVVLGDVGRSPRMQYHTSSLCKTVRRTGTRRRVFFFFFFFLNTNSSKPHNSFPIELRNLLLTRIMHILSAQDGYTVNLIGYRGAEVISELQVPLANGTAALNYISDV